MRSNLVRGVCFLASACLVPLFSGGCASYAPQGKFEVTETHVDLEAKNFVVRKLGAQGGSSRPYLFGFTMGQTAMGVPLASGDVQARAWRELNANWDGEGSSVFHNIGEEWATYGIPGILIFHTYTVTSDIYEFTDEYIDYATRGERGL